MLEQWWRNFISDSFIYHEYISIFTQEYILNIVSYFWKTRFYLKVNFILFERIYIFFLIEITMLEDVLLRIQVLFNCTRPRFEASFIFFLMKLYILVQLGVELIPMRRIRWPTITIGLSRSWVLTIKFSFCRDFFFYFK